MNESVACERPIGVFDSGIGGLTVLRELRRRLPREDFVYLGDSARVPYGTKGEKTVRHFALEALACLNDREVKAVVVACNTATALAIDLLEARSPVPVFGVIEPGVRAALARKGSRVGVIGTTATVGSDRYAQRLRALDPAVEVLSRPCPLFVPLAEEGWVEDPITESVAQRYLEEFLEWGAETMILGCTHYPLLKGIIGRVMGSGVGLVDSAEVLADAVACLLEERCETSSREREGRVEVLVTDVPQRFARLSEIFLSLRLDDVEVVDLEAFSSSLP